MPEKVWLTNIAKDYTICHKLGLRYKNFDEDWQPAQHETMSVGRERLSEIESMWLDTRWIVGLSQNLWRFSTKNAFVGPEKFSQLADFLS